MKAKRLTPVYRLLCLFMCTLFGVQNASAQEAYAYIASTNNNTMYFYYDTNRSSRNSTGTTYDLNTGTNAPGWQTDGARQ